MGLADSFQDATATLFESFDDVAFNISIRRVSSVDYDTETGALDVSRGSIPTKAFVARTKRPDYDGYSFTVMSSMLTSRVCGGDVISFSGSDYVIKEITDNTFSSVFTAALKEE